MSKSAIVLATRFWNPEPWLARFRNAAPDREVIFAPPGFSAPPRDYVLACWKPEPEIYRITPAPRLICSLGAGVDHILKADPPTGIPITRIVDPDLTGRMVEFVVLHALYHLRQMTGLAAAQRERRWTSPDQCAARDVTIGLMGVGELGQASAAGLMAVGFNVIGWGRAARTGLGFESHHGAQGLETFLGRTDILVSLLPSTPETRGLIDLGLLKKLRRNGPLGGPAFINAGRGDAVVEADMVSALTTGVLRAASLDVFVTEPLPQDHPLWALPNVVITPHNAADSSPEAVVAAVLAETARAEAGLPPLNPVDPTRGY